MRSFGITERAHGARRSDGAAFAELTGRRPRALFATAGLLLGAAQGAAAAELVTRWPFSEAAPPYADLGPHGIALAHDADTALPTAGAGVSGLAALMTWRDPPRVATRLSAAGAALQRDSFGFSFWIRPADLKPFDSLLAKEMAFDIAGAGYARLAWQVCLRGDNGAGLAPVELIVRGCDRTRGDFFGNAISEAVIPLSTDARDWIHLAGGYDADTGFLAVSVNGVQTVSGNSRPGAVNADGGPLAVGCARNGADFVAFAGLTFVEDLQLYAAAPTAEEAAFLHANPGQALKPDFRIAGIAHDAASGDSALSFDAVSGADYRVDVSPDLSAFTAALDRTADVRLTWDGGTATPLSGAGLEGDAALLNWVSDGSSATRLAAAGQGLQRDSFGFSLWIRPVNLNPYDHLIAKEMAFNNAVPAYARMAWAVHLLGDEGGGLARLQVIVRGDDRARGDFFGTAISAATLPLRAAASRWLHVAGGYDAPTGDLRLFVDGVASVSGNSSPGAHNSGGGAFTVGSVRNGADFVAFAGVAYIDDVQLYGGPPSPAQAAWLKANPGAALDAVPRLIARWTLNEDEAPYALAAGIEGLPAAFSVSKAAVDAALGPAPRGRLFFRVHETRPATGTPAGE